MEGLKAQDQRVEYGTLGSIYCREKIKGEEITTERDLKKKVVRKGHII